MRTKDELQSLGQRSSAAPPAPTLVASAIAVAAYPAVCVALELVLSTRAQGGFLPTPWIPQAGLGLALLAIFGWRFAPVLLVGALIDDFVVHDLHLPVSAVLVSSLMPPIFYGLAAWALSGPIRIDRRLLSTRDLSRLLIAGAISTLLVGLGKVATLQFNSALPDGGAFFEAVVAYWVGAFIGVAALTPFLLLAFGRRWRMPWSFEAGIQLALLLGSGWIVFRLEAAGEVKRFFLFFIPVMWIALRYGIRGAATACLIVLVAVVVVTIVDRKDPRTVIELQALTLTLTVFSYFSGAAVDERRRETAARLAMRDQFVRLSRLTLTGEIGSTVAHELNQPLAAVVNYVEAAKIDIAAGVSRRKVGSLLDKAVGEALRAGEILGRLRSFLRHGTMQIGAADIGKIADEAVSLLGDAIKGGHVEIVVEPSVKTARALADNVHLTQVFVNLLSNAIQALSEQAAPPKRITIGARAAGADHVTIFVADSGPGVPADMRERIFETAFTTKPSGLGLGLAISRTLIEAQGGQIWYEPPASGTAGRFCFTLPVPKSPA